MGDKPLELHGTDVTSLVLGIAFLGAALAWLLVTVGFVTTEALVVVLPVVLVAAGVTGLAVSWRRRPRAGTGYGTGSP